MFEINQFFETMNLRGIHWGACFVGVVLCVYTMQAWSTGIIGSMSSNPIVGNIRRGALWLMALSFLWALGYAEHHPTWQPWPPDLMAIIAVDIFLSATLVGAYLRRRELAQTAELNRKVDISA